MREGRPERCMCSQAVAEDKRMQTRSLVPLHISSQEEKEQEQKATTRQRDPGPRHRDSGEAALSLFNLGEAAESRRFSFYC